MNSRHVDPELEPWLLNDGEYYAGRMGEMIKKLRHRRRDKSCSVRAHLPFMDRGICIGYVPGTEPGMTVDQTAKIKAEKTKAGVRVSLTDVRLDSDGSRLPVQFLRFAGSSALEVDEPVDGFVVTISPGGEMELGALKDDQILPLPGDTSKPAHDFVVACQLGLDMQALKK